MPVSTSSDLSDISVSPSRDVDDPEELDDISEAPDEDVDELESEDDDDGTDSVTERIRAFNKKTSAKEAKKTKVTGKKTAKKRKAEESDAESTEYEDGPKKRKGKKAKTKKSKGKAKKVKEKEVGPKVLRAKAAVWDDLPDWEGGTGSPLMTAPADVLDRCFGAHQDLEELWFVSGKESSYPHRLGFTSKTKTTYDGVNGAPITSPNRPPGHPAWIPFTRDIKPWSVDPNAPEPEDGTAAHGPANNTLPLAPKPKNKYYTPHGPRAKWTRAQYTVYKEEKSRYANRQRRKRVERAEQAAAEALAAFNRRSIKVGKLNRSVLGVVLGRKDGEEAVKKDEWGLPVVEKAEPVKKLRKKRKVEEAAVMRPRMSEEAMALWKLANTPQWLRYPEREWEVPETEGEDELEPEKKVEYDKDGKVVVKDYWPSKWRALVAEEVNTTFINQTDAISTFKVSKTELITLRHNLITNALSAKQPQQMFIKPAVEALAYRSHGGYAGHVLHLASSAERAKKSSDARQAKRDAARANGDKVPKRKHILDPMEKKLDRAYGWLYNWGEKPPCSKKCWCKDGGWK